MTPCKSKDLLRSPADRLLVSFSAVCPQSGHVNAQVVHLQTMPSSQTVNKDVIKPKSRAAPDAHAVSNEHHNQSQQVILFIYVSFLAHKKKQSDSSLNFQTSVLVNNYRRSEEHTSELQSQSNLV